MVNGYLEPAGSSQLKRRIFLFLCKVPNIGEVNTK